MKQYKNYISSLKGFACLLVMIGHFLGLIKYSPDLSAKFPFFAFLKQIRLDFLLNESFWLQLFFIASGYLIAQSSIKNIKALGVKSLTRFLRLGFPILFANCIIFILYLLIGFKNADTSALFTNEWFQGTYNTSLNFIMLLKSPFDTLLFSNCYFNSTYWVLSQMFFASLLIYVFLYVSSKFQKPLYKTLLYLAFLMATFLISKIIFGCFLSLGLAIYEEQITKRMNTLIYIGLLAVSFLLCVFAYNTYTIFFFFLCLMLVCPKIHVINTFLSYKPFDYIGKISFGIFVFHWPVICSVGSYIILRLADGIGLTGALFVAIAVSLVISVILAIIFNLTAEKWCSQITRKLQNKLMS